MVTHIQNTSFAPPLRSLCDSSLGTITKLQAMPENKGLEENIPSDALKLVELFALQELSCESLTKKEERTNEEDATAPSRSRNARSHEHGKPQRDSSDALRRIQAAVRASRQP